MIAYDCRWNPFTGISVRTFDAAPKRVELKGGPAGYAANVAIDGIPLKYANRFEVLVTPAKVITCKLRMIETTNEDNARDVKRAKQLHEEIKRIELSFDALMLVETERIGCPTALR